MTDTTTRPPDQLTHPATLACEISAITVALAELQSWSDAHPDMAIHRCANFTTWIMDTSSTTDAVRAMKDGADRLTKETSADGRTLFVQRDFGAGVELQHQAVRDEVCTARVVGTETVTVPDPEAPLVEVERDIIEWDCGPLLAGAVQS